MRSVKALRIQLNGEPREVEENISILELIASLSLKSERVAIELNHMVVRRRSGEARC